LRKPRSRPDTSLKPLARLLGHPQRSSCGDSSAWGVDGSNVDAIVIDQLRDYGINSFDTQQQAAVDNPQP
jgi:hypothetical protein